MIMWWSLKWPWLCHNGGMLEYVQAKLPSFLTGVNLGLARGRQELKVLDQTSQSDGKNRQCKNDSGATPSANPKGKVPKVIAIGFHMQLLLQEPLWPELLWLLPVCRVVGQPPCIHQYLALSWDLIATFCWISGWFTSSAMPHSIDHRAVSIAEIITHNCYLDKIIIWYDVT